ncbi:MAG: hypothetical protein ACRD3A_11210 [Terriglobales bacterium]
MKRPECLVAPEQESGSGWCFARQGRGPFIGIIDQVLEADKGRPVKQRHASKRIFGRLRGARRRVQLLRQGATLDSA